ncbi:MAG: conjugal transfer protein TraX [Roseburia sp.]|nr:conjugal transfer protein TraX [Roseburia sp.]MCM1097199.1 conjugal transfer protein TraX [Ruminococcus flavefaciens]
MDGIATGEALYQASQRKRGLTGSTIKIIAVVSMLIDHIAATVLTRMLIVRGLYSLPGDVASVAAWLAENGDLYLIMTTMRAIGRLGFPIFCFLLTEGFQKTRNLKKYILRLGLFALISEIPFDLAISGRVLEFQYQNVYFTLFLGILSLTAFDYMARWNPGKGLQALLTLAGLLLLPLYGAVFLFLQLRSWFFYPVGGAVFGVLFGVFFAAVLLFYGIYRKGKGSDRAWRVCADLAALAVLMAAADLLRTDYAGMGVLTIAVMYCFRRNKAGSMAAGCGALNLMCFLEMNPSEIPAFFALLPIALYNGERGLKMKYFFYVFYPAHLLLLWLISAAMGMGGISAV